jgi:hypothetical protein
VSKIAKQSEKSDIHSPHRKDHLSPAATKNKKKRQENENTPGIYYQCYSLQGLQANL